MPGGPPIGGNTVYNRDSEAGGRRPNQAKKVKNQIQAAYMDNRVRVRPLKA